MLVSTMLYGKVVRVRPWIYKLAFAHLRIVEFYLPFNLEFKLLIRPLEKGSLGFLVAAHPWAELSQEEPGFR